MRPRTFLTAITCLLFAITATAQTGRQPFSDIGKKVKVLTLTDGRYEEFFDDDSIQQIGSAWINVNTMQLVKLKLTEEEQKLFDNSASSRFLSIDPLEDSYPFLTPYQFASNNPIAGIDLDGKEFEWFMSRLVVKAYLKIAYGIGSGLQQTKSGIEDKYVMQSGQADYQNDNVPQPVQNILNNSNSKAADAKIAKGVVNLSKTMVNTSFDVTTALIPTGEAIDFAEKGISVVFRTLLKKEAAEIEEQVAKKVLSPQVRKLYQEGKVSQALDVHYEDLVREKVGGKSEIIDGREYDAVTNNAIIQAKRSISAIERPQNFLSKSTRNQIKATIELAKKQGKEAQFWFKYGVSKEVRNYIEGKGAKVITGLGN